MSQWHDPTRGSDGLRSRVATDQIEKRFRVPHKTVVQITPAAARTTAGTTYADAPTTDVLTTSFEKYLGDTKIVVTIHGQTEGSATTTVSYIGVSVASTDYAVVTVDHDVANNKDAWSGAVEVSGVAKGTLTVTARWHSGSPSTGTLTTDTADKWSMVVEETY